MGGFGRGGLSVAGEVGTGFLGELVWVSPQKCWVGNGGRGPAMKAALEVKLVLLLCLGLGKAASIAFGR